jgi:predicted transcriptional regulator
MPRKGQANVHLRLEPELLERVNKAAEERYLSVNYLMIRAIEEFLERLIPIDELLQKRGIQRGEGINQYGGERGDSGVRDSDHS